MRYALIGSLAVSLFFLVSMSAVNAQHATLTETELMNQLPDAAPAEIVKDATILNMDAAGKMKTYPDQKPTADLHALSRVPMCADAGAMEAAKARTAKGPAPRSSALSTC